MISFLFFLLSCFLGGVLTFEVIYEKNFQNGQNCLLPEDDWYIIDEPVRKCDKCITSCSYKSNLGEPISLLSSQYADQGFQLTIQGAQITSPYTIIGVDILYMQPSGSYQFEVSLNNQDPKVITDTKKTTEEIDNIINCYYDYSQLMLTTIHSGITLDNNKLILRIKKQANQFNINIKKIKIWTNCIQNCQICINNQSCGKCLNGFEEKTLPSGNKVCEQIGTCSIPNCFSCASDNLNEICIRCYPGFVLDVSGLSCSPIGSQNCGSTQYQDISGNCVNYSNVCKKQDQVQPDLFTPCSNQIITNNFKCPDKQKIILYYYQNYSVYNCVCDISDCSICSSQDNSCQTCKAGYSFDVSTQKCIGAGCNSGEEYNSTYNQCVPICVQGQFLNGVTKQCDTCSDANCQSCSQELQCDTCKTGYSYDSSDKKCYINCPNKQYLDKAQNQCFNCTVDKCEICTAENQCDTCQNGNSYDSVDKKCYIICLSGQYQDKIQNQCFNCTDNNCQTCTTINQCSSCNFGYTYDNTDNKCYINCLGATYLDKMNNVCLACTDSNCLSCQAANQCNSCKAGYTYENTDKKCYINCSGSSYLDKPSNTCYACSDTNCLNCSSANQCSLCKVGYTYDNTDQKCYINCSGSTYLDKPSNTCKTCTDINCASCLTVNQCTTCKVGYTYDSTDKQCYINCSGSTYLDKVNNICKTCTDINCLSCSTINQCSTCKVGFTYDNLDKKCYISCSGNTFLDKINNICKTCTDTNCLNCLTENQCIQCQIGFNYDSIDQKCYTVCQSNQYLDKISNQCINCGINCQKCSSNQCNQCQSNYLIDPQNQKNCIRCQVEGCKTCVLNNPNICSSCSFGYTLKKFICDKDCKVNNCQECDVDGTSCTLCNQNYSLNENGSCQNNCQIKNCLECDKLNSNICSKCQSGYQINNEYQCTQQNLTSNNLNLKQTLTDVGYQFLVSFSQKIVKPQKQFNEIINVIIEDTHGFTYNITQHDDYSLIIQLNTNNQQFKERTLKIEVNDSQFIQENGLQQNTITQDLKTYVVVPSDQKEASQNIGTVSSTASTVIVSSIIPIAIFGNFYILINTIDITGFFYYNLFLNIRHPENVSEFYSYFKNFQFPFIPNMFENLVDPNYSQQCQYEQFRVQQYDNYFLKSTGQSITTFLIVFGLYVLAKIGTCINIKFINDYCQRVVKNTWEFSGIIELVWNVYIYQHVGILLQFQEYEFSDQTYLVNYILHSIISIPILILPFYLLQKVRTQQNIKSDKEFQIKFQFLISGTKIYDNDQTHSNTKCNNKNNNINNNKIIPENVSELIDKHDQQLKSNTSRHFQNDIEKGRLSPNSDCEEEQIFTSSFKTRQRHQQQYSKYMNSILFIRKWIYGFLIVYLYYQTELQVVLISFLHIGMIIYLVYIQPLESKFENIKSLAGEFVLLSINICDFFLIDDKEGDDEVVRLNIGWIVVALSAFILLWHTGQMIVELLKSLLLVIKKILVLLYKTSQQVKPSSPNLTRIDKEEICSDFQVRGHKSSLEFIQDIDGHGCQSNIFMINETNRKLSNDMRGSKLLSMTLRIDQAETRIPSFIKRSRISLIQNSSISQLASNIQ